MPALRRAVVAVTVLCTVAGGLVVAHAATPQGCALGGPTPGARVIRLELPHPMDALGFRMRLPSKAGARLVEALFLVDARGRRLLAYDMASDGASPENAVVRVGGVSVAHVSQPGPAAPFGRGGGSAVLGLAAGTYYLVGFGTGSAGTQWGGELDVPGPHVCTVVGGGRVFSRDLSTSSTGTDVEATGVAVASGAAMTWRTRAPLVLGLIQATHEIAGTASIAYRTPTSHGTVRDDVIAFRSTAGGYRWVANATAAVPVLAVAGVAVDLPSRT